MNMKALTGASLEKALAAKLEELLRALGLESPAAG